MSRGRGRPRRFRSAAPLALVSLASGRDGQHLTVLRTATSLRASFGGKVRCGLVLFSENRRGNSAEGTIFQDVIRVKHNT